MIKLCPCITKHVLLLITSGTMPHVPYMRIQLKASAYGEHMNHTVTALELTAVKYCSGFVS